MKVFRCLCASFLAFLFIASTAVSVRSEIVDRIVAVVNGDIITLFELNQALKPVIKKHDVDGSGLSSEAVAMLRKDLLEKLIDSMLLGQEINRYDISVSTVEIENYVRSFKEQNNLNDDQLNKFLQLENMTKQEYEDKIRQDLLKHRLIGGMVQRKIVVTSEEVQDYYENNKDQYQRQKQVRLELIVLPPSVDAASLRRDITVERISFTEAARKHSIGPGAEQGGDIGLLGWDDLGPVWREALEGVPVGEMSQPFLLEGKEAFLRLTSLDEGELKPLSEVESDIMDRLYGPKFEAQFTEYMLKLRKKAVVDVRL
jgi:peptidyl-prolyl cis-trans isomerase SurA